MWQRYNRSSFDGKLALGYRTALSDKNTEATDNILSIDDIKVTFAPSPKDTETAQKDVNVYYSGNTFCKPGESVTITGEQLGSTVGSMKIKKLVDGITDVNNSDYILEQSFDTAASKTVSWDELNAVAGSEIPVNIVQTTKNGINIDLPDGTDGQPECYKESGMYAELVTLEETLTKDGKTEAEIAAAKNELVKQVLEYVQNKGTDCVYRDLYSKPNAGNYIFITQGQGTGQTRKVIDSINIGSYTYFTLEEPFIVSPNRNSICMFFSSARNGAIITNSNFKNGRFVGHYGLNVNTVWDGNTLENSSSGISVNPFQAVSWYLTVKDNVSIEPFAVTAEGVMHQPMGACASTGIANSFFAMNYRNNTVGQDGEISAFYSSNMYDEYAQNVVFENNVIVSDKSNFSVAQAGSSVDGIYLKNNCQYTDISDKDTEIGTYNNSAIEAIKAGKAAINSYGTSRIVCTDFEESSGTSIIGDVNGDGKVSLKDVSAIRYYLSGYNINIDLERADVNEDGFVDSRDLFGVRFIVLGYSNWKELIGITTSDGEEDPDDDEQVSVILSDDFSSKEKSDGIWNWQAENARSAIINSDTRDSDGYITSEGTTKGVPGRQDAIPTMAKDYSFNPATDLDKRPFEVSFVVSSNYYAKEYWADGMFIYPLIQCKDDWSSASYINVNAARGFATDYLSGNANYGKLTVEYIKSTGFSGGNGARPLIYLAEDTSKEEFLNYTMTYDWSDWENGNVTITYKICNLDGTPAKCNPDCENGNEAVVKYHFKDTDCNFTIGFIRCTERIYVLNFIRSS